MNYSGLRLRCRLCNRSDLYVTTEEFTPDGNVHGGMLAITEKWSKRHFRPKAPLKKSTKWPGLLCICGGPMAVQGKFRLADPLPEPEEPKLPDPPAESEGAPAAEIEPVADPEPEESVPPPWAGDGSLSSRVEAYRLSHPKAMWREVHANVSNPYPNWQSLKLAMDLER